MPTEEPEPRFFRGCPDPPYANFQSRDSPSNILPLPGMPVFSFAAVEFVAKLTVACAIVGLVRWLVCPPRDGRVPVALVGARPLILLTIAVWQFDLGIEVYEQHGAEALPV